MRQATQSNALHYTLLNALVVLYHDTTITNNIVMCGTNRRKGNEKISKLLSLTLIQRFSIDLP